jgi:Cu2+-exporting ATPase
MQKTTIEIGGLIAILDFLAIEKRLRKVPGVKTVAMNAGSSTTTVTFDEAVTSVDAIMRQVEACSFHCQGESVVPTENLILHGVRLGTSLISFENSLFPRFNSLIG